VINKLRKKFIVIAMLSVFAVLALIVSAIDLMNYRTVVKDADTAITMILENGGEFPEAGAGKDRPAEKPPEDRGPDDHARAEMPFDTRYFSVTFGKDGTVESSNADHIAAITQTEAEKAAKNIYAGGSEKGFYGNYRFRKQEDSGTTMVVAVDCYRSLGSFRSFLFYSIIVSLIGLAAVFLLIVLISGFAVRPVAESYQKQKRFITDAGHELRTPLTVIDADVSVLETEAGESEWLDDIKAQTKRLSGLTDELVYLSKMDEGRAPVRIEFPLSDVVSEQVRSFASRASVEGKTITADVEPDLSYEGDQALLKELVSVLVDNALKYSDAHAEIKVSLKKENGRVVLSTENPAADADGTQLAGLFDRFARADRSREEQRGFGLGLSIAKAVCEAHGGSIKAFKDGVNVVFRCEL